MLKSVYLFFRSFDTLLQLIVRSRIFSLLKNTTLISSIGLVDILRVGQMIQSKTYRAFEPFFVIAIFYYVLVMLLSTLGKTLERKVNKSDRH